MVTFWLDPDGYEFLVDGRFTTSSTESIAHHRVLAFAWGLIDDLDDPREVDHVRPIPWLNVEDNLDPVDPDDHARRTRRRARRRRREVEDDAGEVIAGP